MHIDQLPSKAFVAEADEFESNVAFPCSRLVRYTVSARGRFTQFADAPSPATLCNGGAVIFATSGVLQGFMNKVHSREVLIQIVLHRPLKNQDMRES
jgi:hypothetical protein